jgi:hypothetical protein
MRRRKHKGKAVVTHITWRSGVQGYQARLFGRCYPGTTKYYACLKHGIRNARVLAYQWLGEALYELRFRERQRQLRKAERKR